MNNPFIKFETFGTIAESASRKKLAQEVFDALTIEGRNAIGSVDSEVDNFATATNSILSNPEMKEACENNTDLSCKVTLDILDFINKTKKQLLKSDNPFEDESKLLTHFTKLIKSEFEAQWAIVAPKVSERYKNVGLNIDFYERQFRFSTDEYKNEDKSRPSFESVREHFTEKWSELLLKEQTRWELNFIDQQRRIFCETLYKQIDQLKTIQQLLEPFTSELGRLWDMSKGSWSSGNFDILKRYAELLKKDTSLKYLAEMLGRMRQAEKQYEEELYRTIVIKPEWRVEHASKSDLIGVRESDDLSSLLPSETALLADDTMQAVFFKKFAEKKLQTFEYQAKLLSFKEEEIQDRRQKEMDEAKGPFIICIDTSGSMHGTPETVAKTLCFAILKIAVRENRKCYLISFSTGLQTLELSDLRNSLDKVIDFLSMSFHGGTDATPAMHEAIRLLTTNDYKKADIVIASDFIMPEFDLQTKQLIVKAKENKTRFHSLVIGSSQNSASIAEFDNNWIYDIRNTDSVLVLVKSLSKIS